MFKFKFNKLQTRLKKIEQGENTPLSENVVLSNQLQDNQELIKNLFNNAGTGYLLFDKNLNIVYCNDRISQLTKFTFQELLDAKLDSLFQNENALNSLFSKDTHSKQAENIIIRKDKSTFLANCIFVPSTNNHEIISEYHLLIDVITENIEDEKKLKIERTYFKYLFEFSPEALAIIDQDGKITNVNTKFTKLFRYSPSECLNKNINILLPNNYFLEESNDFLRSTFTNRSLYIETLRKRKDDVLVDVSITSTPISFDENTRMAYYMILDITERKKIERDLQEAKTKAEESNKLKSSFLGNLSHEIRTPMNAIVGFSSLLSETESLSDEQRAKYGKNILTNCDNLVQLIDNIIDISKIEAKQLNLIKTDFKLVSLLEDLFVIFNKKITENKIRINLIKDYDINSKTTIYTDEDRLRQILYNLLDNAIKYTKQGHVKYGFSQSNKDFITIFVEDTGIGISKSEHEKIFKRFIKIENSNQLYGGIGIGLYISKKLIEELGGRINVESQAELGSKFSVSIPIYDSKKQNGTSEILIKENKYDLDNNLDLTNKDILIVDDSDSSFIYLESLLLYTNAKITRLNNGNDAINLINEINIKFDLVIVDANLPDISGYETARAIRRNNQSLPIIAQSPSLFQEDKSKSFKAGCNRYLQKPIKPEDLYKAIQNLRI